MSHPRVLNTFSLAMINVAAIFSLRNLPLAAEYGLSSIFFLGLAAIVFLLPSALVCAELASRWPGEGGVYHWVKIALGKRWAFIAIWSAWMLSIVWFPTILSFCVTFFVWSIAPDLSNQIELMMLLMMALLWGTTLINFMGMKASSRVSTIGVILGTILPSILLFIGAAIWCVRGMPIAIDFQWSGLIPEMHWSNWVFLAGLILSFEGMEITAYHVKDTVNPRAQYPRALALSVIAILVLSMLGAIAVAVILPLEEIDLVSGIVQVFSQIHHMLGIEKALWVTTFLIFLGVVSTLNSWVIGPAKGILAAYPDGFLPQFLSKTNQQDVPVGTLLFQAVVGSCLIALLMWLPSVQSFYWFFTLISVQLTLVMYTLIFISYLILRKVPVESATEFSIPGRIAPYLIAGLGLLTCALVFSLGFIPPDQLAVENLQQYKIMLVGGLFTFILPAVICISRQR